MPPSLFRTLLFRPRRTFSSKSSGGIFSKLAESIKGQAKDEDLKTSVKKFEDKLTEIKELESVKRAKELYKQTKEDAAKQNEALLSEVREKVGAAKETLGRVSSKVGDTLSSASKPIKDIGEIVRPYVPSISESELAQKLGKKMTETEESMLEGTNAYRYGGYKNKEARERSKARQSSEVKSAEDFVPEMTVEENTEAGESVVLHKTSKISQMWESFKDNNPVLKRLHGIKQRYDESNNVFVFFMREFTGSIAGRFSSVFAETETAKALREISLRDRSFNLEQFMKDAHEFIIPEILDGLLMGDLVTLRTWCSEATFNLLKATFDAQLKAGHKMEGRVLDLRHIEIVTAKLLDDTPVIVVTFTTQQISVIRDTAGKIVEGKEDRIENVNYVMALAKEEAWKPDSPTKGWKLLEIAIRPGGGW